MPAVDDPPLLNTKTTPLTLDEMWNFLVAQRGFNASPGGRDDKLRQKPATIRIDPKGKGPALGPGYQTFAALQVVSADGKAWAIGSDFFSGGGGKHAEDGAAQQMEAALLREVRGGYDRIKGGKLLVLVDQDVCESCQGRLQQLAQKLKLVSIEAYVPERSNLRGTAMVSPKTTMRSALSALTDIKGRSITVAFRLSFSRSFAIPKGIFKYRLPNLAAAGFKTIGAGVIGILTSLLFAWLRSKVDSSAVERQLEAHRPQIEAALDEKAPEILKLMNEGKVPYANVAFEVWQTETLQPEPGGPPIRFRDLPMVELKSVTISDQNVNEEGSERRTSNGTVTEITSRYVFSVQIGVLP